MAKYHAAGKHLDYTPVADVAAGQLVKLGSQVGVADNAIPANTLGALTISGIYRTNAVLLASVVIGAEMDIDFAQQSIVANGSGDASVKVFMAQDSLAVAGLERLIYLNHFGP